MSFCVTGEVKLNSQNHTEFELYLDPSSKAEVFNLNYCNSLSKRHSKGVGGDGGTKDKPPAKQSSFWSTWESEKGILTAGCLWFSVPKQQESAERSLGSSLQWCPQCGLSLSLWTSGGLKNNWEMGRAHHIFPTGHNLANVLPRRKSSSPEKHSLIKTDMDILEPSPAKGHEGDEGLGASVMKGETESWQRSAA